VIKVCGNGNGKNTNFLLAGVGGQGAILASDILTQVGFKIGCDVKKAEVHGMSQRGGSVISHVRWGTEVFSPVIPKGEADVLVAFEKLEAARFIDNLRPGGLVVVNEHTIVPLTVNGNGGPKYPEDEKIRSQLAHVTDNVHWVPGAKIAASLGNAKAANVVILGALAALLNGIDKNVWVAEIEARVPPKYMELNRKAFEAGREAVS
jgi:indolepyruvate ferredoxin oxidoreductase beta subunit